MTSEALCWPRDATPYEELPWPDRPAERIEALWRYRARESGRRQTVLPDGRMDVAIHCRLDGTAQRLIGLRLVVTGPADRFSSVATRADSVVLGVRFALGWGPACLRIPGAALRNQVLRGSDAQRLLGKHAVELMAAHSVRAVEQALRAATDTLAREAKITVGQQRARRAIRRLREADGRLDLQALCADAGCSESTLRRDLLDAVGLPMRKLSSVLRLQRAMALLGGAAPASSLGQIALAAGYADQSHMTRELRRYCGFTPALREAVPLVA